MISSYPHLIYNAFHCLVSLILSKIRSYPIFKIPNLSLSIPKGLNASEFKFQLKQILQKFYLDNEVGNIFVIIFDKSRTRPGVQKRKILKIRRGQTKTNSFIRH